MSSEQKETHFTQQLFNSFNRMKHNISPDEANMLLAYNKMMPRDLVLSNFMQVISQGNDEMAKSGGFFNSRVDITSVKHACNVPLSKLKPIRLSQLQINKIHCGNVLYARVATPLHRVLGIRLIIEDDAQTVGELGLYNFASQTKQLSKIEKELMPKNSLIAIKEPYFKAFQSGSVGLRIDNPQFNLRIIKPCEIEDLKTLDTYNTSNRIKWYFDRIREKVDNFGAKMDALSISQLKYVQHISSRMFVQG